MPRPLLAVLSLVLSLIVFVPAWVRWHSQPSPAYLEYTVSAGRPAMAQLFMNRGGGYNEGDSSRQSFPAGDSQIIRLPLLPGKHSHLRLDPTYFPDRLILRDFVLLDSAAQAARPLDPTSFSYAHHIGSVEHAGSVVTIFTNGSDPIIEIPLNPPFLVARKASLGGILSIILAILGVTFCLVWTAGTARGIDGGFGWMRWAVVGAVLLLMSRLPGLGDPLLDLHHFRQTQTALSAYWFAREGFTLPAYPLPVLGHPWTAPMEFPTYQLVVAALYSTGLPLDLAARGFALVSFGAACVVFLGLLRRLEAPRVGLVAAGILALGSPFALVWSRAALIEFTAVLLGVLYLACAAAIRPGSASWARVGATAAIGALAAATKITTFTVFWPAVALLGILTLRASWRSKSSSPRAWFASLAGWGVVLALPLVAAVLWTAVSDTIKAASPFTTWLTSGNLAAWNFGSFAQRLEVENWAIIGKRVHGQVTPWVWPLIPLGVVAIFRAPSRAAAVGLGLLAGAVGTVTVFFNLYVVHDYYLCACVLPLWLAAGAGVGELARLLRTRFAAATLCVALALSLGLASLRASVVKLAYKDTTKEEIYLFAKQVRAMVPPSTEILIFGDDWNPRLPYYTERKALMVKNSVIPDDQVAEYARAHGVHHYIVAREELPRFQAIAPSAMLVIAGERFSLFRNLPGTHK